MAERASVSNWKIAGGLGCGMLLVSGMACAYGFSQVADWTGERREEVYRAECPGNVWLTVEYAGTHNAMAGVTTDERFEVMYGEQRYGAARFTMDGGPMPEQYTWNPTQHRERGRGDDALHLFLRAPGLDRTTELAIEACVEQAPDALLAALEASPYSLRDGGTWLGRRRVYWSGAQDDLVPAFRHGARRLELRRDGAIRETERIGGGGSTETLLGHVRGAPGPQRIDLDGLQSGLDLSDYTDAEGRTLPERLDADADSP